MPKPSRAAYPCQRVAAPLASSFVVWLLGLGGSAVALRSAKRRAAQSRYVLAAVCVGVGVVAAWWAVFGTQVPLARAWIRPRLGVTPPDPVNDPIGVPRGLNPGRVVWVHDAAATDWLGPGTGDGYWWEAQHTNQAVVDTMVSRAVRWVAGQSTDAQAWDALFRYFNLQRGKGDVDYQPGEKIAVKINLTTCNPLEGAVDPVTGEKRGYLLPKADTSPQMILALLRQLVNVVGVAQTDIAVGDTVTYFPNQWYDYLAAEFPNVTYLDHYGNFPGRTRVAHSTTPLYWSTADAVGKLQDYIPVSFAQADYFINFAVLKGHGAGVTGCGKNNYGSMIRTPSGWEWGEWKAYYDMHESLPYDGATPGRGHYRAIVDLMGHHELGGKSLLYLIDGLYGGYYWEATPYKWNMPPFSGDWPSSLFASQDPVAIDSVAYDFLVTEWPDVVNSGGGAADSLQGGAQDYIHEAAQADDPVSGTFYDPENDGTRLTSLGVHEHWNNAIDKQYTRNLGTGSGIELVSSEPTILGIAVAPATFGFGFVDPGGIADNAGQPLVVHNTGNVSEDVGIRIEDPDDLDEWTAAAEPGANVYVLSTRLAETIGTFGEDDVLTTDVEWCDGVKFGGGGNDMAASGTVNQWFQFKAPTTVAGDSARQEHTVTVEVSCRAH